MRLIYSPLCLAIVLIGCTQKTEAPVTREKMRCAVPLPGSWKPSPATAADHLFEAKPQDASGALVVVPSSETEPGSAIAKEATRSQELHGSALDFSILPPSPLAKGVLHVSHWRTDQGLPLRASVAFAVEQQGRLVVARFEDVDEEQVTALVGSLTSMSCVVAP